MFTMKTTNPTLDIQIMHYGGYFTVLYWKSSDLFYCTTTCSHMLPSNNTWKEISPRFGNGKNCTN